MQVLLFGSFPLQAYLRRHMSQSEKSQLFQALKSAGVEFSQHYRHYTVEQLQKKHDELVAAGLISNGAPPPEPEPGPVPTAGEEGEAAAFFGYSEPDAPAPVPSAPVAEKDPHEFPGQRLNTQDPDEPIRVEVNDQGEVTRYWFQEEVRKPAGAMPRGRRVLQYTDTGTETKTVKLEDGTTESFEVAGRQSRTSEVKITLPSFQVGIYRDPRFPFRVFTYGGVNGFDLFEVQEFYGGPELVPSTIKRMYVSHQLCYDIRTTVQAIEAEARQLALQGRIQL